jgi:hypothetical protein
MHIHVLWHLHHNDISVIEDNTFNNLGSLQRLSVTFSMNCSNVLLRKVCFKEYYSTEETTYNQLSFYALT